MAWHGGYWNLWDYDGRAEQNVVILNMGDMADRQQHNNVKHVLIAQKYVNANARLEHSSALIMVVVCAASLPYQEKEMSDGSGNTDQEARFEMQAVSQDGVARLGHFHLILHRYERPSLPTFRCDA